MSGAFTIPRTLGEEDRTVAALTAAFIAEIDRACVALPPEWRELIIVRAATTLLAATFSGAVCPLHDEEFLAGWFQGVRDSVDRYRRIGGAPSCTLCRDAH